MAGAGFKNDMTLATTDMSQTIPEITEDEKMNARLVAAAHVSPAQGLARVLDILGLGKQELA